MFILKHYFAFYYKNISDSCSANEAHQERHGRESSKRFPDHPAARNENEVFDCDCGANGDNGGLGGTSCVEGKYCKMCSFQLCLNMYLVCKKK